jgi:D-threo-aldose 1-dehydrogenase
VSLERTRLGATGVEISRVGFGCSGLVGALTPRESLALLSAALDGGISHFDVARSYGSGDAERLVGRFAVRRRHEITITTKVGLEPRATVGRSHALRGAARRVMRASPGLRRVIGRGAARAQRRDLSVDACRHALEASLRELGTDYVDILLLHECTVEDCTHGLLEFLDGRMQAGDLRAFGIGTALENIGPILERAPGFAAIVQHASSARRPYAVPAGPEKTASIVHGAIAAVPTIASRLASDGERRTEWSEVLGMDPAEPGVLAEFALRWALWRHSGSAVLVRSGSADHIEANARIASSGVGDDVQLERFERLVAALP